MKPSNYLFKSFLHAGGVFAYVAGIVWLMSNGARIFGAEDNFAMPILMLLLFVISASITGALVLGKPILLYINGMKREALTFFFATLGWLALFLIVIASTLLYSQAPAKEVDQKKSSVSDSATTSLKETNNLPTVDSNNNKSLPPPEIPKVVKQCVLGGCNGELCVEASGGPPVPSICEYLPEYACFKKAQCEVQIDGECGWTITPELTACRANPPTRE